jgi:outer membrane protein OmpA-like peptidoglycan-associated protein
MQERIRALNAAGVPFSNYHLAKAQAYLDVALDEYLENDRSSFIELALGEANGLLQNLEAGAKGLPLSTYPLDADKNSKSGSAASRVPENRLRPDLWALAERLKQHEQFPCAAEPTAQFEVELLQAIHEDRIGGWRRTTPYIAIAESLSTRAQVALDDCAAAAKLAIVPVVVVRQPEPVPAMVTVPVPAPPAIVVAQPVAAPVAQPSVQPVVDAPTSAKREVLIILSERVFFAFGRVEVTEAGQARMREVASILNGPSARDRKIFVDGYTDDVGSPKANQALSERRAEAVRRALISNGIDPSRLTVRAFGETRPVVPNRHSNGTDDPEASAQNRRVELVLGAQ